MIKPIEKGAVKRAYGNNPVGTHVMNKCRDFGHITWKPRTEANYKCQICLQIKFESSVKKAR